RIDPNLPWRLGAQCQPVAQPVTTYGAHPMTPLRQGCPQRQMHLLNVLSQPLFDGERQRLAQPALFLSRQLHTARSDRLHGQYQAPWTMQYGTDVLERLRPAYTIAHPVHVQLGINPTDRCWWQEDPGFSHR